MVLHESLWLRRNIVPWSYLQAHKLFKDEILYGSQSTDTLSIEDIGFLIPEHSTSCIVFGTETGKKFLLISQKIRNLFSVVLRII